MNALLTAAAAGVAVALELLEAMAIVLAVGVSRRWRDAVRGAVAGVAVCALLAIFLGPLLAGLPLEALRLTIGVLLLLFGLEWLRKGTLRLAGRRVRSSSAREFEATRDELAEAPLPPFGHADWAARLVAFKGVLLLGETWVLPIGVLAVLLAGAVMRASAASLWRDGGGFVLLAGVVAVLATSVGRGARRQRP